MRLLESVLQKLRDGVQSFDSSRKDDRRPRPRCGISLDCRPAAMIEVLEQRVLPTTVWVASTQNGTEGGQNGAITLQRDNTAGTLTVMYVADATSTAQNPGDYSVSGSATFAAGQNTTVINVNVVNDTLTEATEFVKINLSPGMPGMPGSYTLGNPATGTVEIFDNDPPPNAPPIITSNQTSFQVGHDHVLTVTNPVVSGSDPNNDPITLQLVTNVTHGTLSLNSNSTFTYTPSQNYVGQDAFQVRYIDNQGAVSQTVTINLTVQNMPPSISASQTSFQVSHDQTLTVTSPFVTGTDPDGDPVTLQLVTNALHGTLTLNANGTFTFVPSQDYFGTDSFQVRYVDALGAASAVVTVALNVTNMPPVLTNVPSQTSVAENVAVGTTLFTVSSTDPDDTARTYAIVSGNSQGRFSIDANGNVKVVAGLDYETTQQYQLVLQVTDPLGASSTATATINVTNIDEPPTLVDFAVSTTDGVVFTFTGRVLDDFQFGRYVKFGGILAGHQFACDNSGFFTYTVTLGNQRGLVSATGYDSADQASQNEIVIL